MIYESKDKIGKISLFSSVMNERHSNLLTVISKTNKGKWEGQFYNKTNVRTISTMICRGAVPQSNLDGKYLGVVPFKLA